MNNPKHIAKALALVVGLSSASAGSLFAQIVVGPPPWTSTSIQSTGGITYFVHSARVHDCNWIETGPVTRAGTNLSLTVSEMQGWICPECFDCFHTETHGTVLGSLGGGAYRLSIYTANQFGGPPELFLIRHFEVPTETGPTLVASRDAGGVQIEVRGVTAANYSLEASTTLINWMAMATVTGAPFTFIADSASAPFRFYRARVTSGKVIGR